MRLRLLLALFLLLCLTHCRRPTVFLIPHSHCDPGWKVPLLQYFTQNVSHILSGVTAALDSDHSRRFIWSEIVYLSLWWDTVATHEEKTRFISALKRKQIEFVGGGWVMNDEAVTRFEDTIFQISEGHRWLHRTFAAAVGYTSEEESLLLPKTGWQIDPFGAGLTQPYVHSKMAFQHHILNRVDDRLKVVNQAFFRREKHLQFVWVPRSGRDRPNQPSQIFTEVLYKHYSAPVGFDFGKWANRSANPFITPENAAARARVFADIVLERLESYRTDLIGVPMGDDFRFQDAGTQFASLDALIRELGKKPEVYGIDVQYATWREYFEALGKMDGDERGDEAEETTTMMSNININNNAVWPRWVGGEGRALVDNYTDFFPYARCLEWDTVRYGMCAEYWTGFFSSYPYFVKSLTRKASRFSRWAESLFAFPSIPYEAPTVDALRELRQTVALMQHHDTITGTFLPPCREDSIKRLYEAVDNVRPHLLNMANSLMGLPKKGGKKSPPTITATLKDVGSQGFGIVLYNPMSSDREDFVNVTVKNVGILRNVRVRTDDDDDVPFDLFERPRDESGNPVYEFFIFARIPQFGYRTYFVENNTDPKKAHSPIVQHRHCGRFENLTNLLYDIRFVDCRSFAVRLVQYSTTLQMVASFWGYESWEDDAYKFRPKGPPTQLFDHGLWCSKADGRYVQELKIYSDKFQITQTYRLFSPPKSATILPSLVGWFLQYSIESRIPPGREIVVRFTTSLKNGDVFYHDSNGLDLSERRIQRERWGDKTYQSLVSGNYYPMTSVAALADEEAVFLLMSRSSLGVGSTAEGTIEIMLNRNTLGFHKGQINANVTNMIPHEFLLYSDVRQLDELWWHRGSKLFENPIQVLYIPKLEGSVDDFLSRYETKRSLLARTVDPALHSFSIERRGDLELLLRVQNLDNMSHTLDWALDINPRRISHTVSEVQQTLLHGFGSVGEVSMEGFPTIVPFDLAAFRILLRIVLPEWARYLVIVLLSICFFVACTLWWCVVLICVCCLIAKTRTRGQYRSLVNESRVVSSLCSPSRVDV